MYPLKKKGFINITEKKGFADIPSSIAAVGRMLKTMIKSFESKHLNP